MATVDPTAPAEAQSPALSSFDEENRDDVLEYLTELVPTAGVIYSDEDEATMHRGRSAVRLLANGGGKKRLVLDEVADVLAMLQQSHPRAPIPPESEKQAGFAYLMGLLEQSVREGQVPSITIERYPAVTLAEKCARARTLMEEAHHLVAEVLEDPAYAPDRMPAGVVPSGVGSYLDSAIGMLEPEAEERSASDDAASNGARPPRNAAQKALARLMHRFDVLTSKLMVVVTHSEWRDPFLIDSDQLGHVAIVRETADELSRLYCEMGDWAYGPGGMQKGPWVHSFGDDPDADEATEVGAQS